MTLAEEAPIGAGQHNSKDAAVFQSQSEGYSHPVGGIVLGIKINVAFEAGEAGNGQPGVLDEALIEVNGVPDGAQDGSVQEQFAGAGALFDKLHHGQVTRWAGPQSPP